MDEKGELDYIRGKRSVYLEMLRIAILGLGYEKMTLERMALEREETIITLRSLCEEYGDNEWESGLRLSEIIEKHLNFHRLDRI